MSKENFNNWVLVDELERTFNALGESLTKMAKELESALSKLDLEMRPPAVIKKELKHEKNPMRIKELNRELNASYKHNGRKRR